MKTFREDVMEKIDVLNTHAGDFPDGAFFAYMEENGITVEDLEEYSEWCAEKKKKRP